MERRKLEIEARVEAERLASEERLRLSAEARAVYERQKAIDDEIRKAEEDAKLEAVRKA